MFNLEENLSAFDDVLNFFQSDISSLRTGRAIPALIEAVHVEVYGAKTPLSQVASITAPDPKTLTVQPWDKNLIKDIERALSASDIDATITADKELIRLSIAPLNEESRRRMVKILHDKLEDAKINLKQHREKIRTAIAKALESREISEDEKFSLQKKVDEVTKNYSEKIKQITDKKETEIMTI